MLSRTVLLLPAVVLLSTACAQPNQRAYYQDAIAKFNAIPSSSMRCWLAPDLTGSSAGSNVIAEEEFTHYLIAKNLCRVVEKHPDATDGYTWPEGDRCPCAAGQQVCSAQCPAAAGGAGAAPSFSSFGGSAGADGNDNNRSNDKILERFKKSSLPDKLITYRIDEMNSKHCVVHFRVSDVKRNGGTIEASEVVVVTPRALPPPPPGEGQQQ